MDKSLVLKNAIENADIYTSYPYKGKLINLRLENIKLPNKNMEKVIVEHRGASVVIPVTQNERLIFIKQYRRASGKIILEFPAGTLERNEDPKTCAQRELQEEIGFRANKIVALGSFYTSPGFCTENIFAFLAHDLVKSPLSPDDDEAIDPIELTISKALELIDKNEIIDAKTIICLFKYLRWKNEI